MKNVFSKTEVLKKLKNSFMSLKQIISDKFPFIKFDQCSRMPKNLSNSQINQSGHYLTNNKPDKDKKFK